MLVGFGGVALLLHPSGDATIIGLLACIGAALMWAVGSFASPRISLPRDPLVSTAWQSLLGGLAVFAGRGLVGGEVGDVHFAEFSGALDLRRSLYLITFGSLLAFTSYAWLLQNAPISKVSTYAYVNPVVAIALGWLILDEGITADHADRRGDHRRLRRARRPRGSEAQAECGSASNFPRSSARCAGPSTWRWPGRPRRSGSTRSGSATTCSTDGPERGAVGGVDAASALAAATERVTLGPLVACAGFHPPGVLAKMAATIDEVSGGRFVLGLGAGLEPREFDAFGIPYDQRVSRFEEAFAILRGLLAGERVTLDGAFHTADDAVLLPKPARRMPLMIGSNGPRMLSIALPHVTRGTPGTTTTATRRGLRRS